MATTTQTAISLYKMVPHSNPDAAKVGMVEPRYTNLKERTWNEVSTDEALAQFQIGNIVLMKYAHSHVTKAPGLGIAAGRPFNTGSGIVHYDCYKAIQKAEEGYQIYWGNNHQDFPYLPKNIEEIFSNEDIAFYV